MKLVELFDFNPKQTKRNFNTHNDRTNVSKYADTMGKGSFGNAYQHDSHKRLNQIRKTAKAGKLQWIAGERRVNPTSDPDRDGYLSFIKMVMQSGNNNPYFPIVDNVKTYRDKDGSIFYDIDLEKLYPYETKKILENQLLIDSLRESMFNIDMEQYHRYKSFSIYGLLDHAMHDKNIIKDPKLNEAIDKIYGVIVDSNGHLGLDFHDGNLMWRITGNIPHIVLTDPIS